MAEVEGECYRMLLLLAHERGSIDDEELLLLSFALDQDERRDRAAKQRPLPSAPVGARPDLNTFSEEYCIEQFRFTLPEVRTLAAALGLPAQMVAENNLRWTRVEGLCILLRRLAYPNRLCDLVSIFQRGVSDLSRISNGVCLFIYNRWGHLLRDFTNAAWFTPERVQLYADAISRKCPLPNCFGFIDGTVRPMCRPSEGQRGFYNGKDRVHCLKFQSIVTPDGLVAHLHGPVEGRRHDAGILRESGLLHQLANNLPQPPHGITYRVYGDAAYPLRPQLIAPFKGDNLPAEHHAFNREMSSVRMSVEWGFQKVVSQFAFLNFAANLKVLLQPIGAYYVTGTILTNCHTCLKRSETSHYFNVQPPTVDEYLQ